MDKLFPINQIIKTAKANGINFGAADPKTRLAYLTKLRLLPQAIRRKVGSQVSGYYPVDVVDRLSRIERLKDAGLTYPQIRYELAKATENHFAPNSGLVFLFVGLILGYLLNNKTSPVPTVSATKVPESLTINSSTGSGQVYLIAIPD